MSDVKNHSFSLSDGVFPSGRVCYVYLVSSLVGYVLHASLSLFVCVCHRCCISVQGLLATDGFHNHRHHHHLQYDSSISLPFEGSVFLSGEGKGTRALLPSSCQLRWPQKCEQKHFKSDVVKEHFPFFLSFTFRIRVGGGN